MAVYRYHDSILALQTLVGALQVRRGHRVQVLSFRPPKNMFPRMITPSHSCAELDEEPATYCIATRIVERWPFSASLTAREEQESVFSESYSVLSNHDVIIGYS